MDSPAMPVAPSPAVQSMVDRLLRPLVRATDDALRRLDLVVVADRPEPVDADGAAPQDADAAALPATRRPDAPSAVLAGGSRHPVEGPSGLPRRSAATALPPAADPAKAAAQPDGGRPQPAPQRPVGGQAAHAAASVPTLQAGGLPERRDHAATLDVAPVVPLLVGLPGDAPRPGPTGPAPLSIDRPGAPAARSVGADVQAATRSGPMEASAAMAPKTSVLPSPAAGSAARGEIAVRAAAEAGAATAAAAADAVAAAGAGLASAVPTPADGPERTGARPGGEDGPQRGRPPRSVDTPRGAPADQPDRAKAEAAPAAALPRMPGRPKPGGSGLPPAPPTAVCSAGLPVQPAARGETRAASAATAVGALQPPGAWPPAGGSDASTAWPAADSPDTADAPDVRDARDAVPLPPRPLRQVANRLDRALAPVFQRAQESASAWSASNDDAAASDDAPARISNTFNVQVALGGAAGTLDPRQVEDALSDWLRAAVRRQGLLP